MVSLVNKSIASPSPQKLSSRRPVAIDMKVVKEAPANDPSVEAEEVVAPDISGEKLFLKLVIM